VDFQFAGRERLDEESIAGELFLEPLQQLVQAVSICHRHPLLTQAAILPPLLRPLGRRESGEEQPLAGRLMPGSARWLESCAVATLTR
jgi:hypothetical protein